MATVSCGTKAERFAFIVIHHHRFGVRYLCEHLKVSRSGYYAWRNRKKPRRVKEDIKLLRAIERIFNDSKETYGSPRIHKALRREKRYVGRKRVERLMREAGLKARSAKIYRRLGGLHWFFQSIENKRIDLPKPTGLNQHWVADLTYIRIKRQWRYLAVVLDLYSRRVIGWSMGKNKNVQLTGSALMMAIRKRKPKPGLIFHTDRGVEYRSYYIQEIHKRYGILPSMNRPGQCTDNAEMESFFHTLKADLIHGNSFDTEEKLRYSIAGYLNNFYNRKRLHSSLNYLSPVEYERIAA